jgi:hypothetical protein
MYAKADLLAAETNWNEQALRTPDPAECMRRLLEWHHEHGGRGYADTPCTGCRWNRPRACDYTRIIRSMYDRAVRAAATTRSTA